MIKLYIFDSVHDARAFEREEKTVTPEPKPVEPAPKQEEEAEPAKPQRAYPRKPRVAAIRKPAGGPRGSHTRYDPDVVRTLSDRVDSGEITSDEAAAELGTTKVYWYNLRHALNKKHGTKAVSGRKQREKRKYSAPEDSDEAKADTRTDDELRPLVHDLQRQGFDSLRIAARLKIRISKVNKLWDPEIAVDKTEEDEEKEKGGFNFEE